MIELFSPTSPLSSLHYVCFLPVFFQRLWTNLKTWWIFNLHYDDGKWQMWSEEYIYFFFARGFSDGVFLFVRISLRTKQNQEKLQINDLVVFWFTKWWSFEDCRIFWGTYCFCCQSNIFTRSLCTIRIATETEQVPHMIYFFFRTKIVNKYLIK